MLSKRWPGLVFAALYVPALIVVFMWWFLFGWTDAGESYDDLAY